MNYNPYLLYKFDSSYGDILYDHASGLHGFLQNMDDSSWVLYTIPGDINEDFELNIQDIVLLIELIFELTFDSRVDMNQDSILNIYDIIILLNIILDD